jgi:hypothetical protein
LKSSNEFLRYIRAKIFVMPTTAEMPAAEGATETVRSPLSVGTPTKVVSNSTSHRLKMEFDLKKFIGA